MRILFLFCIACCGLYAQFTVTEINPSQSTLGTGPAVAGQLSPNPDGASGGRVHHLASSGGSSGVFFAASEWGGLYKSTDGGQNWFHLPGHSPTVTWDVKVSPSNPNQVVATSFYDGRVNTQAGINVSADGGQTWTHPVSATPPMNFCASDLARTEPSAFGIAFDPVSPQTVYVGTSCGLAISTDNGNSWKYVNVDPSQSSSADQVWSVIAHGQGSSNTGIIDTCGFHGHSRSMDGGSTWSTATGMPMASGICSSLAVSPDEPNVLFATVGTLIYESDDGGQNWTNAYQNPNPQGRIPFVKTNKRGPNIYDLWFGDVSLYRASCSTPSSPPIGNSPRCQPSSQWAGAFTRSFGSHDDMGDILFDPRILLRGQARCPLLMSSDGGIFINTNRDDPACHTPAWTQPVTTPHALWVLGISESPGSVYNQQSLYFGAQDNGLFVSTDAQGPQPIWSNVMCCDIDNISATGSEVVFSFFKPELLEMAPVPIKVGNATTVATPPGSIAGLPNKLDRFDLKSYVMIDTCSAQAGACSAVPAGSNIVFVTPDITANPPVWTQVAPSNSPTNFCAVHVSRNPRVVYAQAGSCNGLNGDELWYADLSGPLAPTSSVWNQVLPPMGKSGFGIFAVDPNNAQRILASVLDASTTPPSPQMVLSNDQGATWTNLPVLDCLMQEGVLNPLAKSGSGCASPRYTYSNSTGPTFYPPFSGYAQPSVLAFSQEDGQTLVAGGTDSGIFVSFDGGSTWKTVTDNSGGSDNPQIPRPTSVAFDRTSTTANIYVGTTGRGVWRIDYPAPPPVTCGEPCAKTLQAQSCTALCSDSQYVTQHYGSSQQCYQSCTNHSLGAGFKDNCAQAQSSVLTSCQLPCDPANINGGPSSKACTGCLTSAARAFGPACAPKLK